MNQGAIRTAHSCASDPRVAAREFHAGVAQPGAALIVFFCSSEYDLEALGSELASLFGDAPLLGCTTAGEIGPAGYRDHSLSGFSLPGGSCRAVSGVLEDLRGFDLAGGRGFVAKLRDQLEAANPAASGTDCFAFLLIDGLSGREEMVARTIQDSLGGIALVGGSAGDNLHFRRTAVYARGSFHSNRAVLALVTTVLPFRAFKSQHFVAGPQRLVVTAADTARRTVLEIDGLPAASAYAAAIGVAAADLDPQHFSAFPIVVRAGGSDYVRSIQSAQPDGSLNFYCAVDEGVVFRVARGEDFLGQLQRTFDGLHEDIGAPQLVLTCDCVLRKLEMLRDDLQPPVEALLRQNNAVGFATYGEQFGSVHVNQTFTGIAIGEAVREPGHG